MRSLGRVLMQLYIYIVNNLLFLEKTGIRGP